MENIDNKDDERMKKINAVLLRIKNILKSIYGDRLIDTLLYGSYAKNTYTEDSDIDIAIILKGKVKKFKEIDMIYDALYDLMLETGELISVNPLSQEEFEDSAWPLFYNIKIEGIRI